MRTRSVALLRMTEPVNNTTTHCTQFASNFIAALHYYGALPRRISALLLANYGTTKMRLILRKVTLTL